MDRLKKTIEAIEKQQPKERTSVWMVGKQLKDMLRDEPHLADTAVTTFRAYFTQWQQIYSCMEAALGDMGPETADKLWATVRAQMEAWL